MNFSPTLLRKASTFALLTLFAFALPNSPQAVGQQLTIGSEAPSLRIKYWLSDNDGEFSRVRKFKPDKIYVIEFWATWCGPCIKSMPHLAAVQQKYADKGVQLISVSSERLEPVEAFLDRKIRGVSEDQPQTFGELTNSYCLTCDPDRSVFRDYMTAAGRKGIPCAFIVGKTGLIEWIGHPLRMEEPLERLTGGNWNRKEFAQETAVKAERKRRYGKVAERVQQLVNDGEEEAAIAKLDEVMQLFPEDSRERAGLMIIRVAIAMNVGGELAVDAIKVLGESGQPVLINGMVRSIAKKLGEGEEFSEEILAAALEASRKSVEITRDSEESELAARSLEVHANMLFHVGQLDEAIEAQQQAVDLATNERLQTFLAKLMEERSMRDAKKLDAAAAVEEG